MSDKANPVADARLEISMSLNALAKKLGLSRQYISRAEQGTYTSLNPQLVKWVSESEGISKSEVMRRYIAFQDATRNSSMETYNPAILVRTTQKIPGYKLFEQWRAAYWPSTIAFCNAFCIHPETVHTYEEGIRHEMPEQLKKIMWEFNLLDRNWNDWPEPRGSYRRLTA